MRNKSFAIINRADWSACSAFIVWYPLCMYSFNFPTATIKKKKISFICKCYFLETTMEKDSAKDLLGFFFYDPLLKAMMLIDDNKGKKNTCNFRKEGNRNILQSNDYDGIRWIFRSINMSKHTMHLVNACVQISSFLVQFICTQRLNWME